MNTWNEEFIALFKRCLSHYRDGDKNFANYYSAEDLDFLSSIGYQPREFFDFVEDHVECGDPAITTALLVAAVRRDYFLSVQKGVVDRSRIYTPNDLPTFGDKLDGIAYLPRIITKARAKLRGQLDPDVMFCCGGDRHFLAEHGHIHPADFLRYVWAAKDDDMAIAKFVRSVEEKAKTK